MNTELLKMDKYVLLGLLEFKTWFVASFEKLSTESSMRLFSW